MIWQTTRFDIDLHRPRVMGIVNLTPDSLSDGGQHGDAAAGLRHAERLLREGAGSGKRCHGLACELPEVFRETRSGGCIDVDPADKGGLGNKASSLRSVGRFIEFRTKDGEKRGLALLDGHCRQSEEPSGVE